MSVKFVKPTTAQLLDVLVTPKHKALNDNDPSQLQAVVVSTSDKLNKQYQAAFAHGQTYVDTLSPDGMALSTKTWGVQTNHLANSMFKSPASHSANVDQHDNQQESDLTSTTRLTT